MNDEMQEKYLKLIEDIKNYFKKNGKNHPENKLPDIHRMVVNEKTNELYEKSILIEPSISNDLTNIIEPSISELKSFEHRIKDYDSLKRKIIADSKKYGCSYSRASYRIFDAVRYTIVIPDGLYVLKTDEYLKKLESMGYSIVEFKNNWGTDSCQGFNVRLRLKASGDIFEIQFHTPFGYHIKEGFTRDLYEIARDDRIDEEITDLKVRANIFRELFFKLVPIPKDALDYKFNRTVKEEVNERVR